MPDCEENIWRHVKRFRHNDGERHRYPRFLFVPIEEIEGRLLSRMSEGTKNIISMECLQDKKQVFDIVYDHTEQALGGPVEVKDHGDHLVFTKQDQ